MTIEGWFKPTELPAPASKYRHILGHTTIPAFKNRASLKLWVDGTVSASVGGSADIARTTVALAPNTYYHVALRFTGSNGAGTGHILINGVERAAFSYSGMTALHTVMRLGNTGDTSVTASEVALGYYDNWQIHNYAQTTAALLATYNAAAANAPAVPHARTPRQVARQSGNPVLVRR
jgi:hypothetical protein